jgi:Domain of unknown function (DUF4476)
MRSLLLYTLLISLYSGLAQNNLNIFSGDGKTFKVFIKGKASHASFQANVLIEKVLKDTLLLELEFENKKKFPVTFYLLEQGVSCKNKEFNYRLEYDNANLNTRFTGVYDIRPLPNPLVPEKPVIDTTKKYRNNILGHFCELKEGKPIYFNNKPKEGKCLTAMPSEYMNYVAILISKAEVQDQKYTIIENVCKNNCLNIEQLNTLLTFINYEIEKLKLVRFAYFSLVDPSNKKNLEKSFRFETSVNELNSFLNNAGETTNTITFKCTNAASEMLLNGFLKKLEAYGNDAERYTVFKKSYAELCYSVNQATSILNKFIHDREKLDIAKLLYDYCIEQDKFMKVSEVFSYNQTTSELKDFIDKQKQ